MKPNDSKRSAATREFLLLLAAWCVCVLGGFASGQESPTLHGKLVRGEYTSTREVFQVHVPKSSNWAGVPFSIGDLSADEYLALDLVTFQVADFGEVLIAGVRHLPDELISQIDKADPQVVLKNICLMEVRAWKRLPDKPEILQIDRVSTPFGEGMLCLYVVEKGSIMKKVTIRQDGSMTSQSFDALVAVMVARSGDQYFFALAENDGAVIEPLAKDPRNPKALKDLKESIQKFFGTIKRLPNPRFPS